MGLMAQQKDDPKCKDHTLFNRMPDYWIRGCVQKQFDVNNFVVAKGKKEPVEGQFWRIDYYPQNSLVSKPSELQIQRSFENAIKKQGGEVVWSEKGLSALKLVKDGQETWIEVRAEFTGKYWLSFVQKKGMAQDVIVDAAALGNDINATGHAAVYGIYFDSGQSSIKPESAGAIAEIAKLMKAQPALKLFVVGHTDNQGGAEFNVKLSQGWGEAVLQALVLERGIPASRLWSWGCGLFAPIASNDSEDGRAKNSRVELIKQ
jgi:OmpA-OmpF porin, OOP family